MRLGLAWLSLAILPCFALHESDAGKIDWRREQIGLPRIESVAVAPKFQLVAGKNKRSAVVTLSKSNVLAAVNAPDGEISWRHVLDPFDLVGIYKSNPGFVITLSGPGGANLRSYNVTNGDLVLESRLHSPSAGQLLEPPNIGQDIIFSVDTTNDIFALTNAHIVRRVDGLTGETKWTWTSEDQTSSVLYAKLVMAESTIFVVGLTKSIKSYTLHLVSLDASTGSLISSVGVSSSITSPSSFLALTSAKSPHPTLAWLEDTDSYIHSLPLKSDLKGKSTKLRSDMYREIKDVGVSDAGVFMALKKDSTAHVLRMNVKDGVVENIWEFDNSAESPDNTPSIYSGGFDWSGKPYVGSYHYSHALGAATFQALAVNGPDDKPFVTGFRFPYEGILHGDILHYALEVANPDQYRYFSRIVFTTSSGTLQQWLQNDLKWTREESLSEIAAVEFVDLPEVKIGKDAIWKQSFVTRITRHLHDAKDLPQYAAHFGRRFLMGSAASTPTKPSGPTKKEPTPLFRDEFGFRKLLVVATSTGKIFGIDSDGGHIVWSRFLAEALFGGSIRPVKIFTTVSVSDARDPEVVLVAERVSPGGNKATYVYRIAALTGLNAGPSIKPDYLTADQLPKKGGIVDAWMVRDDNRTIVIVGDDHKVQIYPSTPTSSSHFSQLTSHRPLTYALQQPSSQKVTGFQILPTPQNSSPSNPSTKGIFPTIPIWSRSIPPSEQIISLIRRPHEPVASLGKVLGDRRTLYKYLNPHLIAIVTSSKVAPHGCGVYLIDGAKGTVLYHATLPASSVGMCDVHAALTENWLVYHYYDERIQGKDGAKGWRIVSVELYEGDGIDDKTKSADLTSYSYASSLLTVFQRSFVYTTGVTALAMSSTKYGISSKDLIIANTRSQIRTIPRRLLDPRRPLTKPTAQEQEEWLIQYDPVIPDDPRRVISHTYDIAGTSHILTSPALLESTSIVFTYGLDLFLTRIAPSNTFDILSENFNKVQLVLTILALGGGVMVTKPMVRRKMKKQKWYYS